MIYNKKELLEKYRELALKLGKLPSKREVNLFICSDDPICRIFQSYSKLKAEVILIYPELKTLMVQVEMSTKDLEAYRLKLHAKTIKNKNQNLIKDQVSLNDIEKFAQSVFTGQLKPPKQRIKPKKISRIHTLMLSDLHIGADIDAEETGTENFSTLEEARRIAAVVKQASEFKVQYRQETELVIALLGDIIDNLMHDARSGAVISEQVCRAIHILSQGIGYLGTQYPKIKVVCATGNHGRITSRHKQRAVHQKFDSYETMIYYAIKYALRQFKNITFEIPKTPLSSYSVHNMKIGYTHADTVINPGNPHTSVNVKLLENQVNKLNAALNDKEEYKAIIYGHTHLGHLVHLPNGTVLVGNGGLPPADSFSASIGSLESNAGQWIFESVPGHVVGDSRYIKVGLNYDKDSSLDSIIKPWKSFND